MGFRRNILENIPYGVIYFIFLQSSTEPAKEAMSRENYICASATRGQTQTEQSNTYLY